MLIARILHTEIKQCKMLIVIRVSWVSDNLIGDYPLLFVYLPEMLLMGELLAVQAKHWETGFNFRSLAIPTDYLSNLEKLAGVVVKLIEAELNKGASQGVYLYGESKGSLSGALR